MVKRSFVAHRDLIGLYYCDTDDPGDHSGVYYQSADVDVAIQKAKKLIASVLPDEDRKELADAILKEAGLI